MATLVSLCYVKDNPLGRWSASLEGQIQFNIQRIIRKQPDKSAVA